MIGYMNVSAEELNKRSSAMEDVVSEIAHDVRGMFFTLDAIADQGCQIEPEQMTLVSNNLYVIQKALCTVLEHLQNERRDKSPADKGQAPDAPSNPEAFSRMCKLGYQLVNVRDTLLVVSSTLNGIDDLDGANASIVHGAAYVIESVASDCDRMFWEK